MSEENVEIVRRGIDAFSRGDLDGVLKNFAPDAVVDWSNSLGFDAGVFRGHGEIRAFLERFRALIGPRVEATINGRTRSAVRRGRREPARPEEAAA